MAVAHFSDGHPMLPYLGQGACQAMEDGCVLAAALEAVEDDPVAALRRYEELRRPRASRVVITSRERGEDNHLVSPWDALTGDVRIAVRSASAPTVLGETMPGSPPTTLP